MKVGVGGASGKLGTAVLHQLRQRAPTADVVAITRTPDTVSGPFQVRSGDYDKPELCRWPMPDWTAYC